MVGRLWTTGIMLKWGYGGGSVGYGWWAQIDILDDGFCDDGSVRGQMTTSYASSDIDFQLKTIIELARHMNVEFRELDGRKPSLYIKGDGEDENHPPPDGWKKTLKDAAEKIEFQSVYGDRTARDR